MTLDLEMSGNVLQVLPSAFIKGNRMRKKKYYEENKGKEEIEKGRKKEGRRKEGRNVLFNDAMSTFY